MADEDTTNMGTKLGTFDVVNTVTSEETKADLYAHPLNGYVWRIGKDWWPHGYWRKASD